MNEGNMLFSAVSESSRDDAERSIIEHEHRHGRSKRPEKKRKESSRATEKWVKDGNGERKSGLAKTPGRLPERISILRTRLFILYEDVYDRVHMYNGILYPVRLVCLASCLFVKADRNL